MSAARPFEEFVTKAREEARARGFGELELEAYALGALEQECSKRIRRLLAQIGDRGACKGCGAEIYWLTHRNGKKAPYTVEALNHFADCEQREQFRRKEPA